MSTAAEQGPGAPRRSKAKAAAAGGDARNLPAAARAPLPPKLAEHLAATPEDEIERLAFALWEAGRKDEAVTFLKEMAERHRRRGMPADHELVDVTPVIARAPASPEASDRGALPPPPLPRRPFVLAGLVLAVIVAVFFGGFDRLAAALPGWLGSIETTVAADSTRPIAGENVVPAEEDVATAETVTTVEPVSPDLALRPSVTAETEVLPPEPVEETAAAAADVETPPVEEEELATVEPALTAPVQVASQVASATVEAPPAATAPRAVAALSISDLARGARATPAAIAGDAAEEMADETGSVTLQALATVVDTGPRLPRPRPEPSPALVAVLNAPPAPQIVAAAPASRTITAPAPRVAIQRQTGPTAPYVVPDGRVPLTIIGRVEDVPPPLDWRQARAERFQAMRRALAERRAAAARAWRSEPWPPERQYNQYPDGRYADAAPYPDAPYQPQVPWAYPAAPATPQAYPPAAGWGRYD